jgi:AcrR family transcriptional regulator
MSRSSAKKNRPQGRPSKEDSADIRQQIMDVAVDLFASQGYAATPVREIAERVGANPAMIHYYFGSKEALLHAALEQLLEPLAEAVAAMQRKQEAPLQDLVSLILGAFARKPSLPVLLAREVLLPGGARSRRSAFILAGIRSRPTHARSRRWCAPGSAACRPPTRT